MVHTSCVIGHLSSVPLSGPPLSSIFSGSFKTKPAIFQLIVALAETGSVFAPAAKNTGNEQQNARRERLFIRKSALSAIFCCGFGDGKYYHRCRKSCLCPFCQKIFLA